MGYIVTGGQGVIGRHLVDQLLQCGGNVTVVDRARDPLVDQLNVDITRFEELWSLFKDADGDCVIHLAGEVGRLIGELRPNRMTYVNIKVENILMVQPHLVVFQIGIIECAQRILSNKEKDI